MPSPWARLALIILLVASLGLKAWRSDAAYLPNQNPDGSVVLAALSAQGFSLETGDGLDANAWLASKGECRIEIAAVSALGWHRSAVEARAAGQNLAYAYAGQLYGQQPVMLTQLAYYWHKLVNYFYPSEPPPVFAILQSAACASENIGPVHLASYLPQD